jgi:hypothetical protein
MKVFLHTRTPGQTDSWNNTSEEFDQVPAVGEHVCRAYDGSWFAVRAVVHLPKSAATPYDAEVYAVEVDHVAVVKAAAERWQ